MWAVFLFCPFLYIFIPPSPPLCSCVLGCPGQMSGPVPLHTPVCCSNSTVFLCFFSIFNVPFLSPLYLCCTCSSILFLSSPFISHPVIFRALFLGLSWADRCTLLYVILTEVSALSAVFFLSPLSRHLLSSLLFHCWPLICSSRLLQHQHSWAQEFMPEISNSFCMYLQIDDLNTFALIYVHFPCHVPHSTLLKRKDLLPLLN